MEINQRLMDKIANYLVQHKLKIAIAESMSAGYFCTTWSLQSESGEYLEGGVVAFSRITKEKILQVPADLIDAHTAESLMVTESMVDGLGKLLFADIYIGITGLAYEGKDVHPIAEVGDVFLVIRYKDSTWYFPANIKGKNATEIYIASFNACLRHLADILKININ